MNPAEVLLILRLGIGLFLFGFLALLLSFLWRDLKSSNELEQSAPPAYLRMIEVEKLQDFYTLEENNLVGRAEDNTLVFREGTISAYHARLSCQRGTWWIEDLGSRNGTLLNEIPVSEPLILGYGDKIQFGSVKCEFVAGTVPHSGGIDAPANEAGDEKT